MAARVVVNVRIDPAAIVELMSLPDGPVGRHMMVVGEEVKQRTRLKLKQGFPRDWLGPKIVKRTIRTEAGVAVQVGAADINTQPHEIRGNPMLHFAWPKGRAFGRDPFYGPVVHHPGSNFERYLGGKLVEALTETLKGV